MPKLWMLLQQSAGPLVGSWHHIDYRGIAGALALGALGGALFAWIGLPLAWMIGSITATCAAAIAGFRIRIPPPMRSTMVVLLGILLGGTFRPEIVSQLPAWALSLSFLALYIVTSLIIGSLYLRRVARLDPVTAYFTAAPGGLIEMVTSGRALGGDDRVIAMSHSMRIMLTVFAIPICFALAGYDQQNGQRSLGPAVGDITITDYAILAFCAVGAPIASALRLPTAPLVGPLVLSAAVHLAGLTSGSPPAVLIAAAQVVVGAAIGTRFSGVTLRWLGSILISAIGLTAILLVLDVVFALALSLMTDLYFIDLFLAFAPGGTVEMSLVAITLGADSAFVASHHIMRIVLVIVIAPILFRFGRKRIVPPPPSSTT